MKKLTILFIILSAFHSFSQTTNKTYKKRVLESSEVDILTVFYGQNVENAAVTGGIGTEKLTDFATNFVVSIPLNEDDVFLIDATISAYSSASSSNLNPFDSGASYGEDENDDKPSGKLHSSAAGDVTGSPWIESPSASKSDGTIAYNHSSESRNTIVGGNISFAN